MKNNMFLFTFSLIFVLLLYSNVLLFASDFIKVTKIADGDTITIEDGRRVRYVGINAPEIKHENSPAEPYGDEAKQFNSKAILYKAVQLEFDSQRYDRYGRTLAYVYFNGQQINDMILKSGYAYILFKKPNIKYNDIFLISQRNAMSSGKGIWKKWAKKKGQYMGNKNSRRFHLDSCPSGRRIKKKNQIRFQYKWDAFWEGYAPCKKCLERCLGK